MELYKYMESFCPEFKRRFLKDRYIERSGILVKIIVVDLWSGFGIKWSYSKKRQNEDVLLLLLLFERSVATSALSYLSPNSSYWTFRVVNDFMRYTA